MTGPDGEHPGYNTSIPDEEWQKRYKKLGEALEGIEPRRKRTAEALEKWQGELASAETTVAEAEAALESAREHRDNLQRTVDDLVADTQKEPERTERIVSAASDFEALSKHRAAAEGERLFDDAKAEMEADGLPYDDGSGAKE